MDSNKEVLTKYWVQKSTNSFNAAKILQNNKSFEFAIHSLYFSCFDIITALTISHNISRVKTHNGLQLMFKQHFIDNNILENSLYKFYSNLLRRWREIENTPFAKVDSEELNQNLTLAEKFIDEIKKLIQN